MNPAPARAKVKSASALRADAGFTLIEVIVAIVLIGASLLTVVGAASAAFGFQAVARQQQIATTIATKKMEEVRALPWTVISGGMSTSELAADSPNVVDLSGRPGRPRSAAQYALARCGSESLPATEDIPTGAVPPPAGVLSPHRVDNGTTVDGVSYSWATYVSRQSANDPYHATVCVTWNWRGGVHQTMVQSWLWSPQGTGCVGRPVSAVGGPCASVAATLPDGAVTIGITHGGTSDSLSFALAGSSSQISLSDKTVATASFTAAAQSGSTAIVDARTAVTADDDGTSAISSYADAGSGLLSVPLAAIPTTGTWLEPTTAFAAGDFKIRYEGGEGRASASAVTGAAAPSCPQPLTAVALIGVKSPICASSAVLRPYPFTASPWVDTRMHIGDGLYFVPLSVTPAGGVSNYGYRFGTYAVAGGGTVDAQARRQMQTVFHIGGLDLSRALSSPSSHIGEFYLYDCVALSATCASSSYVSNSSFVAAAKISKTTACGAATHDTVSADAADDSWGCYETLATSSSHNTTRVEVTWGWIYTPSSTSDTGPSSMPRTVSSTSPALDLRAKVTRTYCTAFGKTRGRTDYSICDSTADDIWYFDISLSLGAATVTYDRQI